MSLGFTVLGGKGSGFRVSINNYSIPLLTLYTLIMFFGTFF